MKCDAFRQMLALLGRLDDAKIAYTLRHSREDALMVQINVPGERWEVEFVDYDDEVHVEIERFKSDGAMCDESLLDDLFARHSFDSPATDAQTSNHKLETRQAIEVAD